MATNSKTTICNQALSLIGQEDNQVTTASLAANGGVGEGKNARQCNLHYQQTFEEVIRAYIWNCCKTRTTGTNNPVATVPVITSNESGIDDDFTYSQTLNGKAEHRNAAATRSGRWTGSQWEYGTWADPTFTATFTNSSTSNTLPETGWVAVASGSLELTHDYGFYWTNAYLLPSDCLRVVRYTDSATTRWYDKSYWVIEGRTILTEYTAAKLLYLKEPSFDDMDPLFAQVFYYTLAMKLAIPIAGTKTGRVLKGDIKAEMMVEVLPEARRVSSFEKEERPQVDSEIFDAMFNGGGYSRYLYHELSAGDIPM